MEKAYKSLHEKNTFAEDARKHIVDNFNIDTIFKDQWVPFFTSLQDGILPKIDTNQKMTDNKPL
jgi:hypothetical protein